MGVIRSVSARNFKCFRGEVSVDFEQTTYLIGPNNSGKSALLTAVQCFFDTGAYGPEHLNKTELAARKEGYNRSDITVSLDLSLVIGKKRKERMLDRYGCELSVTKSFTWRERSRSILVAYTVGDEEFSYDELDGDVQKLLEAIVISYIHPQEGPTLLEKAQDKFKERLFQNWGRHVSVADRLKGVQTEWDGLRKTANAYLSSALTTRLRHFWPGSETKVVLPERIEDIVAISDITFRGGVSLPEITLPSQGTGAQSVILYQTHYILDSDRSLHRGMYFPVWLLEEPESFLHADIAFQLARLLSSDEWSESIQMIISTHSPIILAGSRQNPESSRWAVFHGHTVELEKRVEEVSSGEIRDIGNMMGDANFDVYFTAARRGPLVFIEDSKTQTIQCFEQAGIHVAEGLGGTSNVKKYLSVMTALGPSLFDDVFFVVDGDQGVAEFESEIGNGDLEKELSGWRKVCVAEHVYLVILPDGLAVEGLFAEWDAVLNECIDEIYDGDLKIRSHPPATLSKIVTMLRSRNPADRQEVREKIQNHTEVKNRFWRRVERDHLSISASQSKILGKLLNLR